MFLVLSNIIIFTTRNRLGQPIDHLKNGQHALV